MSAYIILQTVIIRLGLKYDSVEFWTLCGKFMGHGNGQPFSQTSANDIFLQYYQHMLPFPIVKEDLLFDNVTSKDYDFNNLKSNLNIDVKTAHNDICFPEVLCAFGYTDSW